MQLAQLGIFSSFPNRGLDELYLIIGDSNGDGRGASIPTVPAGILYDWNGSSFDEITTQTVANDGSYGSAWQEFAIQRHAVTGHRIFIVQHCLGGSEFYPNGDNNNWYTSGSLYSPAVTAALAAQAALGGLRVNVIVVLGINDIRGAQTTANILTAVQSLVSRLDSDFSTPNMYFVMPGRDDTNFYSAKAQFVRRAILLSCAASNVHAVSCMLPYANWSLYDVDNLHLIQDGYDLMGEQINRYITNSTYNKPARSIIASMRTDLPTVEKDAISTFTSFFSDFWQSVDTLHIYVADSKDNAFVDWGLIGVGQEVNTVAFTANVGITTDGAADYMRTFILQDNSARSTQTDFVEFVKTGTVTTGSGTAAYLFGKSDAGDNCRIYQSGSQLHVQALDLTDNAYATDPKFADNTIYGIARNGTNKMMKKDGADVVSVTQASTGTITTVATFVGTSNTNGTPAAQYMNAQYECYGYMRLSTFTWSSFVTALNTMLTVLKAN
jgi:hypothetical protein